MKVKAKTSFAGVVTMYGGQIKDIADKKVAKKLIECGYVEELAISSETKTNSENENSENKKSDEGSAE